jgi:two-component system, OmpR family, phosphate regulon sensor histidine kinase PhoR
MIARKIKLLIFLAVTALTGLLIIQIFWFKKAFDVEDNNFSSQVSVVLRSVSHQLLLTKGDSTTAIPPVERISSNSFLVKLDKNFEFETLSSLMNKELARNNLPLSYQLSVFDCDLEKIVWSYGIYKKADVDQTTCQKREHQTSCFHFSVIFPDKQSYLVNRLGIWIFTSIVFVLILLYFSYSLHLMLKEKKLSAMRKDFINNMTHELKTPISNISIASEVLQQADHNLPVDKSIHYARIIYKENQRLKKQIEKVLELAAMENGKIDLKLEAVDVNEMVGAIVESYELIVSSRKGEITFVSQANNPIVTADRLHLSNVIHTLIDNAIKYSGNNIAIAIDVKNMKEEIVIAVSDKGIGIPRNHQKNLFDQFYRVPSGDQHDIKGFGLGLTYAKMIVDAHGGWIKVESIVRKGSTFSFSLNG